ncbi:hypothetical protein ACIBK8_01290 [Streptomyces sp. NPDC050161]|uniref:hypothetical protein n=1 Tax=Streptomyces sp. NPDC050161 TaxID=3365604 RepID=UPI0037894354
MTALADRPHSTLTDYFEEAARIVERAEEGVRLEFIGGVELTPGGRPAASVPIRRRPAVPAPIRRRAAASGGT